MTEERVEYNYYEHLIPKDILLDTFCFTTGIELSRFVNIHRYFKNCIQNCTNSLPSMAIKQLVGFIQFCIFFFFFWKNEKNTLLVNFSERTKCQWYEIPISRFFSGFCFRAYGTSLSPKAA